MQIYFQGYYLDFTPLTNKETELASKTITATPDVTSALAGGARETPGSGTKPDKSGWQGCRICFSGFRC
jgi:hypothetical protein